MPLWKYKLPAGTLKDVYFWASVMYVVPAVGYVTCHLVEMIAPKSFLGTASHTVYFILSIMYLIDSILYYESWRQWRTNKYWDPAMWGEVLNIVASVGFTVSSGLYYLTDIRAPILEQFAIIFAVYWISEVSFAIFFLSSLMYYSAWRNVRIQSKEKLKMDPETGYKLMDPLHPDHHRDDKKEMKRPTRWCYLVRDSKWRDYNFLGEFFNMLPSAIYVVSGMYVIFASMALLKDNLNGVPIEDKTSVIDIVYNVFGYTQLFYFIADVLFLLDSVFYFVAYIKYLNNSASDNP